MLEVLQASAEAFPRKPGNHSHEGKWNCHCLRTKDLELANTFNLEDKLVFVESPPDEINRRRLKKTIKPRGARTQ